MKNSILMIEDEATLKDWFEMTVKSFEKELIWAGTMEEALAILKDPSRSFDLVVSDFNLGAPMNGLDFWRIHQKINPHIPFLLMSGLPDQLFHEMVKHGEVCPPFLLKPFTAHEFKEALLVLLKHSAPEQSRRTAA